MAVRVTVLGCGASAGVPAPGAQPGGEWGACDPVEPRNRRRRASILIESETTRVLVDATPDLRAQLVDVGADIDAIIFTHAHADHVHGIDDLRAVCRLRRAALDAYAWPDMHAEIESRFGYAYAPHHGDFFSRPVLLARDAGAGFTIGDLRFTTFRQDHGVGGASMGLRVGTFGYSTDVYALDDAALTALRGVEAWIVGCLDHRPNPAHANVDRALEWIRMLKPARAWLTHLGFRLDYATLAARCPPGVAPAYDGLQFMVGAADLT